MHESTSRVPSALLERLQPTARVAVLTGAGISAASGVPTFRGTDGLWKQYRAEDLATPDAFANDPRTVWEWYGWRRDLVAKALPNPGHVALAQLARHVRHVGIITQNVDGLHRSTPAPSNCETVELHGCLWVIRCTRCHREREDTSPGPAPGDVPHCASCGGLERPGVVWFGEMLPHDALERAQQWTFHSDVFLVVGTSSIVHPAAGLATLARHGNAYVADFNLEESPAPAVQASVVGPCEETLPMLIEALTR
jgi:NAD-dependent deacetylase